MAYRFPDYRVAQLNAMGAALSLGDKESARILGQRCADYLRSYINQGVIRTEGIALTGGLYEEKEYIDKRIGYE